MEALKLKIILIVFLPLAGAMVAGLARKQIGKIGAHVTTISLMSVAALLSLELFIGFYNRQYSSTELTLYTWGISGNIVFQVGFLLDKLTVSMLAVVNLISLAVHLYTIGYMRGDPGYQRFFSYISLFTFAMLMLVTANNFLQLFFGWEAVGLVSYLLIGFWFKKETAIFANLKAFLVNRVGDFGFLLGIAGVLMLFGSLNYSDVFAQVATIAANNPTMQIFNFEFAAISVICICLFIGAMGKSAQVPLHVWLPDSMEGPTPISALIHAATMVTAGVFMVTRMSPLFEHSEVALNFIMIIGSITCFFMGLLGVVAKDIKRVIAYSTLSQLGYMMVATSVSAYSIAMFHLITHAFFKALLFLGAGSVIIGLHHEQNIMKMGNLRQYMPITYITMLIGTLALVGFPGFAGFYSKDLIIEATNASNLHFANIGYYATLFSVFITSLYSFRLLLLVFHTNEKIDKHLKDKIYESPKVVTIPLIFLAIGSVLVGFIFVEDILTDFFADGIFILPAHNSMEIIKQHYHGVINFTLHGFIAKPFFLVVLGFVTSWLLYIKSPRLLKLTNNICSPLNCVLENKYWCDDINNKVVVAFTRYFGWLCWRIGDKFVLDGIVVHGCSNTIAMFSRILKKLQTGYLYHYTFVMIAGFFVLLAWLALS